MRENVPVPGGEFLLYQTEDGHTRVECRLAEEDLWLTQAGMAELFQTSKQNIAKHLNAIFADGELAKDSVVNSWLTTAADGKHYRVLYYNLAAILAVGYRVRLQRGIQFRRWATERLREYLVKGFVMDDERLKNSDSGLYFEQLLERIRDIRSSKKVFWRKVLDIYATSIDYDPTAEASQQFFANIQNKMHWAARFPRGGLLVRRPSLCRRHVPVVDYAKIRRAISLGTCCFVAHCPIQPAAIPPETAKASGYRHSLWREQSVGICLHQKRTD